MLAFFIHRTSMRDEAQSFLRSINAKGGMSVSPVFLRKSYGKKWQQQAESRIYSAELVIVYDVDACLESENTKWELECAKKLGKSIIKERLINAFGCAEMVAGSP